MSLLAAILHSCVQKTDDPTDVIASLLLAAKEDPDLYRRMIFLLTAPAAHREPLVNSAIHEMRLRGESAGICAAFATFIPDEGAKAALNILNPK